MTDKRPPSLARAFAPPDGMRGEFGWMCGYSADAEFMEEAVTCFSGYVSSQRRREGRTYLALMLDPENNKQIPPSACHGVNHLPAVKDLWQKREFLKMHAKVALILFRHKSEDEHALRLIVSTGNWTRQTILKSLDLFWQAEVRFKGPAQEQELADCLEAWGFLRYLREFYDRRNFHPPLPAAEAGGPEIDYSPTIAAHDLFENKLAEARDLSKEKRKARFMDNREQPFLKLLAPGITALDKLNNGAPQPRNYLAMGSGFFQGESSSVLMDIEKELKKAKLLKPEPQIDVFINPASCQGLASASTRKDLTDKGWKIKEAATPKALFAKKNTRTLHAKFLFSANFKNGQKSRCSQPWVYLGSGNLTNPGFSNELSRGNLEAGVLFEPKENIYWEKQNEAEAWVEHRLPIRRNGEPIKDSQELKAGEKSSKTYAYFAAPVSALMWRAGENGAELAAPATAEPYEVFRVEAPDSPLPKSERESEPGVSVFAWPDDEPKPVEVEIRWQQGNKQKRERVPVMDKYGRLAAVETKPVSSMDKVMDLIEDFSACPESEEDPPPPPPTPEAPPTEAPPTDDRKTERQAANYPVRSMMKKLEQIAEKQTGLLEADWALWCSRLEETLTLAKDCPEAELFKKWQINPFTPLLEECFLPDFVAKEGQPGERKKKLEKALEKAARAWDVPGEGLGGLLSKGSGQ